ncbi:MAG: hypothetical protein IT374_24965 [Polyangiaceae bacterium]|nr:hypothetical protein [Polyangiaceae bacterium]
MRRLGRGLAWLGMLGTAGWAGCSSEGAPHDAKPQASRGAESPVASTPEAQGVVAAIRGRIRLRSHNPDGGAAPPTLPPATGVSWQHEGLTLRPTFSPEQLHAIRPGSGSTARRADVRLPRHANGAFRVRDEKTEIALDAVLDGAAPAPAAEVDGMVVYAKGGPEGSDVVHRATPEGTEDYVYFVRRPAREEVRYRVTLSGAAGLRLVGETLELMDAGGAPRVRMSPPYALTADGERLAAHVDVEGCAVDRDPRGPWGRPVTPPGAGECTVKLSWQGGVESYPLLFDPTWSTTGSLITARSKPSGYELSNDKVLVFGIDGSGAASELFDPATATWAATGSMGTARTDAASAYFSGDVFVSGGTSAGVTLATCEAYDASTGSWSGKSGLVTPRSKHAMAQVNQSYSRMMVTGGLDSGGALLASVERSNSTGGGWSVSPYSLATPRRSHAMSGDLVVGGAGASGNLSSAEKVTETGVTSAGSMSRSRIAPARTGNCFASNNSSDIDCWTGGTSWVTNTSTAESGPTGASLQGAGVFVGSATLRTTGGTKIADLPTTLSYPVAHTLADGRFLVAGGAGKTNAYFLVQDAIGVACTTSLQCAAGRECVEGVCCDTDCNLASDSCRWVKTGLPDGTCGPIANGVTCSTGSGCGSGFCSDSVCCDTACSLTNDSCLNSKTGLPTGTCGPIDNGDSCSTGASCGSGFCSDGVCCSAACSLTSDSCLTAKTGLPTGTCGPIANGNACSSPSQCGSGFCNDGYCCDSACTGQCVSCKQADTGAPNGTCAPVTINTDPATECASGGDPGCARSGMCNGAGACENNQGAVCAASSCAGGTYTPPSTCNSGGSCVPGSPGTCGDYTCLDATSCRTSCTDSSQCTNGKQCVNGACGIGFGQGHVCSNNTECQSGQCVDGVCCNTPCAGACFSCNGSTGQPAGTCAAVQTGLDPDGDCADSGTPCGADGMCNGAGACRGNKTPGTSCGASSCSGGGVVNPVCDAAGVCKSTPTACAGGYVCEGGACPSSCTGNDKCAVGYFCNASSCTPQLDTGLACSSSAQCKTGQCVDGFCCESACGGACQSCSGLNTVGGINGKCDSIKSGTDPKSACATGGDACGADGLCDGQGQCRAKAPSGTACGATVCVGPSVSGQLCDGNGTCAPAGTPVACPNNILCAAGQCPTECGSSADCVTGHFCSSQKACVSLLTDGAACSGDAQCANGHCVDNVCCDSSCTGSCQSCKAAQTGGVDGKCDNVKDGLDPKSACSKDAGDPCGPDGMCDGQGQCRTTTAAGTLCGSVVCVGSSTANQTCDGLGACAKTGEALCTGGYGCSNGSCLNQCASHAQCQSGFYCNSQGACVATQPGGAACSEAAQCKSGFCVDGVCCDAACDGTCQACAASKTGQPDGKCSNATDGSDPHNTCAKDAGNLCGADGLCDGQGQCRTFATTAQACGPTTCTAGVTSGKLCDGFGTCANGQGTKCQAGYGCNGNACATDCTTSAECAPTHTCKGSQCVLKAAPGAKCQLATDCASGFCVDGVCCNTACDGACRSCVGENTVGGVDGTCDDVVTGKDPRSACPTKDGDLCGLPGTCGPGGECAKFAADGAKCGVNACDNATAVSARCDGAGTCQKLTTPCGAYACDTAASACKTKCSLPGDCAAGASCNSGSQQCAFVGATCADAFTIQTADGKQVSCSPYRCEAGKCAEICTKPSECASGYDCVNTKCVKPTGAGGAAGASGAAGKGGASAGTGGTSAAGKAGATSGGQGGVSAGGKAGGTSTGGATAGGQSGSTAGGAAGTTSKGGAAATPAPAQSSDSGGCGCTVPGEPTSPAGPAALALAVGLVAARRRRARGFAARRE